MRLVTAGIGISLLAILAFVTRNPPQELGVFVVQPSTAILRFQKLRHACGGPHRSWIASYMTYNGKQLSLSSATFQSTIEANQELQKWLQGATRIQEAGPKYDQHGVVVGERIVVVYAVEDRNTAAILWTQHESVFAIETESLQCAVEFEHYRPTQD